MAEMEDKPSEEVIKQVCATLRQWSLEGPPRNPRRTAGELAVSLEAALSPAQEPSQKEEEAQTDPEVNEAAELRRLLGELRLEYEDLSTESRERSAELLVAEKAKAELEEKFHDASRREEQLRASCDASMASSEAEQLEVSQLRRRVAALSAHLSSVLSPVSAACRIRPLSSYKDSDLGTRTLSVDGPEITVEDAMGRLRKFKIDRVLDDAPQEDLFLAAAPWVEHAALGGSSCVFAYGATGSGKTHSILGEGDETRPGLAHHAIRRLIEGQNCGEVRISMLEVYCEQIRDLLASCEGGAQPTLACSRRDGQGKMMLDYVEVTLGEAGV
ncbi:KIN14B [Symbiodinium natans]|uniref:KIN14B protein n=1 Tax=Symbiodinium natans TaxID=878477 RepID=A0A812UE80_9DINO|nr:KIN14B [Symbiodinium natans]